MKASFTHYLKIKWRYILPLLCFGMLATQSAYADECTPDLKNAILELTCDGYLSIDIPGYPNVKMKATPVDVDGNCLYGTETSFQSLPAPHATGTWCPDTEMTLEVTCPGSGLATIVAGNLPDWDVMAGTGAGKYRWNTATSSWVKFATYNNGGSLALEVVQREDPWCPLSEDGKIWVKLDGSVLDKCAGATYSVTQEGGPTKTALLGQTIEFNGLAAGTYKFTATVDTYSCPCGMSISPSMVSATLVRRTGTTTSMACVAEVNLSLSQACKATLEVGDVLLGVNDPCMVAMVDSLIVRDPNDPFGSPLATGSGSPMGLITIDNAEQYVGKQLIVEVYSTDLGNYCWGYVNIEDKSAPVVTCQEDPLMRITCLEYDGTPQRTLAGLVYDCSDFDVNIISENLVDRCTDLDDIVLRKVIVRYNATDVFGNQSETCTDTLEVLRFDTLPGNGILDIPGTIWMPPNFVLDPRPGPDYNEVNPLRCVRAPEESYIREFSGTNRPEPAPVDIATSHNIGGTGYPVLHWRDSNGTPRQTPLLPLNYAEADNAYQTIVDENLTNCSIGVQYEDLVFQFGCKTKILRQWYLYEWSCEGEQRRDLGLQEIIIMDFEAPEFKNLVPDLTYSVGAFNCSRILDIQFPDVMDNCDDNIPITAAIYDQDWNLIGPSLNPVTGLVNDYFDFPIGWTYVVYTAIDGCDNISRDTASVHVIDETPPVVICKEFLAVGLSTDGTVRVPEYAFDNGSYDDCGLESTCVVRMDDLDLLNSLDSDGDGKVLFSVFSQYMAACGRDYSAYAFQDSDGKYYISTTTICTPYVEFCCADNEGENPADIMVVFRATDINGNVNSCMVFVDLQDKQVPEITCLPDIWIDCDFDLPAFESSYADMTDDPLSAYFGDIVEQNDQKAFGIPEKYILRGAGYGYTDLSRFVDGVYYDNCKAPTIPVTIESDIDNCGFGYIKRTYYATDGDNRSQTCVQYIYIFREAIDEASIIWPEDVTLNNCAIPEELVNESFGEPIVTGDKCSLLGISQENQIYTFNTTDQASDACFKIVRTWTIIDWCQSTSDAGQPYQIGRHVQIIKVNDPVGPTITCDDDITKTTIDCYEDLVQFGASATDDCTDGNDLLWTARLEILNNDGTIQSFVLLDETDIVEDGNGNVTYTTTLPIGTHRIIWSVTDRCGNIESCTQEATIINNKKPTPLALNVSTALMNTNGMVEVWAIDFNLKSTHPCYDDNILQYAISLQGAGFAAATSNLTFDCNSAINNYLDFYVFLVTPSGDTLYDFTTVQLRVKDDGICDNERPATSGTGASALITGTILTAQAVSVPNIEVGLLGGNQGASALDEVITDAKGGYVFPAMPMGGEYVINPSSSDDYLNGVTTLDLVLIQRYVLGIYDIESPYQLIAADINKDKDISALDLVELRSVILGFSKEFSNNKSWRFVDAAYEFRDAKDPLSEDFPETYEISALESNMNIDFIGLKVGDVNGSVDAASVISTSRSTHALVASDASFRRGETVAMEIASDRSIQVSGTQFTLSFDVQKLRFVGIEAGELSISAEHLGTQQLSQGMLSVSWSDVQDIALDNGDVLFTALFEARSAGTLAESVTINSTQARAEIYDASYNTSDLILNFEKDDIQNGFALYQNTPNPFADQTRIAFYLPKASAATLTIYDVTGKTLRTYTGSFDKGNNYISVNNGELAGTGVMYYTLATDEYTDTKRMVVLK